MRRCDDRIRKLEAAGRADKLKLRRLARDSAARKAGAPGGEQVLLGLCRIGSVALAPSLTYSVPLFMKQQCDQTLGLSL